MAKRSWPFGVTSWDDTVKFAQLLFGVDVAFENYAERLPHRSNTSFLLFAKGACAEGRPFFEIGDFIAPQLEEIQRWEENVRNNNARPTKSQQMLNADGRTVYYWSAQVTRAPCLCRSIFGADAHQKHVPTSSAMWKAGSRFEKLWDATLMKNYEAFQNRDLRPTWLDKSWQVLWNWNDHNKNHGISPHSDESATYSNVDPITSFSFGHASAKLQNRLTVQEYVCYLTKRVVKNLDAYGRAKAAPKTKSYALDADAKEDPGLVREGHGTGDTGESFEPAFEDALDPDIDGEVRLKAGDAPLKVHHPLTSSQRSQAMTFHRQKQTKFVRDMISVGLLPLTGDEEALHRTAAYKRASGTAVNPRAEQLRLKEKAPMITQPLLDAQRAAMTNDTMGFSRLSADRAATSDCAERAGELAANSDVAMPEAEWRTFSKPSAAMARKVAAFEKSAAGFKLAPEQLSACRWFGEAMDVALQEEENKIPLRKRAQHACLLIGAGGTGKTTIILELMLDVFCRFFPARPGEEERYMIATFSHAQSDAISNDVYRARTCHTACSYRVASLRNKHLALKTKEQEMKQRWQPKILIIQDEISLVPAAVENMMLYRSMRARQDKGLDPASYFHPGELMGHIPILLIAGDFLQIKPANEISLADNLEELIRKMPQCRQNTMLPRRH